MFQKISMPTAIVLVALIGACVYLAVTGHAIPAPLAALLIGSSGTVSAIFPALFGKEPQS